MADFITTSVKTVQSRESKSGSHSEMCAYDFVKALIPTGLTSAAVGVLDLGNQRNILLMMKELVDAHLLEDDEERTQAIVDAKISKLARHIHWGEKV